MFVEICYKKPGLTIDQHAENIKTQDYGFGEIKGYGDPSGAQWIREFQTRNIDIAPARRDSNTSGVNWLQLAVDKINEMFRPVEGHTVFLPNGKVIENAPKLFILRTPENQDLIDELETLAYKETANNTSSLVFDDTRDPKGHFDLLAALRYAILSYKNNIYYLTAEPETSLQSRMSHQEELDRKDKEIKAMFRDPNKMKELEHEADLQTIKEQNQQKEYWS